MNTKMIVGLVAALILVVVLAQNAAAVPLRFLFWRFDASLFVVILLCVLAGGLGGFTIAKLPRKKKVGTP